MSYDNSANAMRRLEERFERLLLMLADMQAAIGRTQQPSYNSGGGQPGGGGGVTYMVMAPTAAITAGLSTPLTGQTVVVISGAATVTVSTNATIYNNMASNTVISKPLVVGPNNDGTYTVITQSC